MRLSSILTLVCCLGALILAFLALFAGSTTSFLQNGEMMTLNVSRLGEGAGDVFNTTDGNGGFFDNLINDGQDAVNDLLNDAATEIAQALNLSDFYSVHMMNYCDGFFTPNATVAAENGTGAVSENVTYCSPRSGFFAFNATKIIEDSLPGNITLQDLQWPQEITDTTNAITTAVKAMVILYFIGIIFTGLAFFGSIAGIITSGRLSACGNWILDVLAFLTLGIASGIATALIVKAVAAINKYGNDIGVSATRGGLYLGLTWGAVALMLIASCVSFAQVCVGRKKKVYASEKPGY